MNIKTIKAYFLLTKPRIIELLLVTTVPTMILAAQGVPNLFALLATLIGGAASAGSANAFNCYIERDKDRLMRRTLNRPLAKGDIKDKNALVFAWFLGVVSVLFLLFTVGWLSAALSLFAIFYYVVVYTLLLKPRTDQNIVWGGVAGCMPVLIAWAAETKTLEFSAFILFFLIFLWTPAHYWPLAIKYEEDYKKAGIPMLPLTHSRLTVALHIVLYAWALCACSLALIFVDNMTLFYILVSIISGGWFLYLSYKLYFGILKEKDVKPMKVFHASNTYLTILFLAIAIDPFISLIFS